MAKKDFSKLGGQFAGADDDELARQQDVQMAESMASLAERQRERLIRQAEQMGLRIVDEATSASAGAALQIAQDGSFLLMGCHASSAGLEVPDDMPLAALEEVGLLLLRLEDGVQLFIGDVLAASERLGYGDITRLAEAYHKDPKTLRNWKYVCSKVTTSLRKDIVALNPNKPLSIGHYNLVAGLDETEQRHWLSQAALQEWSVAQLHAALRTEPQAPREPAWERAYLGMRTYALRRWKKMAAAERERLRTSLLSLVDELDKLDNDGRKPRRK